MYSTRNRLLLAVVVILGTFVCGCEKRTHIDNEVNSSSKNGIVTSIVPTAYNEILNGIWSTLPYAIADGRERKYSWGTALIDNDAIAIDINAGKSIIQGPVAIWGIGPGVKTSESVDAVSFPLLKYDGTLFGGSISIEILDRRTIVFIGDDISLRAIGILGGKKYYKVNDLSE